MNTMWHSNVESLAKEIAGDDNVIRMGDLLGDFATNHDWMEELANKMDMRYIRSAAQFESEYTTLIKDLSEKQLATARNNGIVPCINDKTGEYAIAIGSLRAFDVDAFIFTEIVLVPLEIASAYLPMLASGEFDQIDHARQYSEALLMQAWELRANDIHIEAEAGVYVVRYAIDDKVTPIVSTKKPDFMENAIAVFQKMARVEVRSSRPFQDGQIVFSVKGRKTEWRYHEDRTISGRRVVIRQAHAYRDDSTLESLRYPPLVASMIREVCEKKSGMVLFCGKTGHGKSTGMTTELLELKKKFGWFITMIEDNPEVILDGISQIRVNEEADGEYKYGYAEAIRSSLRADIDVLMVAEVRDSLTANAAFRAALTGHLAMSTLHVDSVDAVVPRLLDLGVDAHTIYSSVTGIFIQLLVSALCPKCKQEIGGGIFRKGDDEKCVVCAGEGYHGRVPANECAVLSQGLNGFKRQSYFSFADTLKMQYEAGYIDSKTIDVTLENIAETF